MNDNTYTAITIGPIYGTFSQAKRTRAIWAASYFFSWFIKQLTIRCHDNGFKLLLPHHDSEPHKNKYGSGLYADRIYFEPSVKTISDLKPIINDVIAEIAGDIDAGNMSVITYLKQFLNIHIVEKEISQKKDVLRILNEALDQQELKQSFAFDIEANHLLEYFDWKLSENSLLSIDAFGGDPNLRFRSIPEIATTTIQRICPNEYKKLIDTVFKALKKNIDLNFIDALEANPTLKSTLKPHHKYYAVMCADGDNIGALLKQISDEFGKLKEFSRQLFEFGKQAEKLIYDYGGNGVYLGGEDIFAFLPIACLATDKSTTRNIFNIIDQLDKCFKDTIGALAIKEGVKEPTLTYGIIIAYIKHPLKETMKKAHQLMEEVKTGKWETGQKKFSCKNALGFRFQKHSGQYIECFYEKSKTCSWDEVKSIVTNYTSNVHLENAEMLSGVIHRLKDDLFFETFCIAARQKRLKPFFENFFNEYVHKTKEKEDFIKAVKSLAEKIFNDYADNSDCKNLLFATLRYIQFINSDKE